MADQSERTLSDITPESQPEVTINNIWIISDTHFEHDNIKKLCYRPADYNEQIIADWREKVKPTDVVLHLGDVAWPRGWGYIKDLPGKKILIRGNHDGKSMFNLMSKGFDLCVESLVLKIEGRMIEFTHVPRIFHEYDINVCGHLHNMQLANVESICPHYVIRLEEQGYGVQNLADLWPKLKAEIHKAGK